MSAIQALRVILIAATPVVELRGAIPYARALGFSPMVAFFLALIGNTLPVPAILLLIRPISKKLQETRFGRSFLSWFTERNARNSKAIRRYGLLGLLLFVALPIPSTGAWTGSMIAGLVGLPFFESLVAIFLGTACAGVLVTLITELGLTCFQVRSAERCMIMPTIALNQVFIGLVQAAAILLGVRLVVVLADRSLKKALLLKRMDQGRRNTLLSLAQSLVRYVVYFFAAILIIKGFYPQFDASPLLAGAGILGLAAGLGAQALIKDIIAGFFINLEDQLRVGDYVQLNDSAEGFVEEVGLRSTSLREWSGKKIYIANSEIRIVRNWNRQELRATVTAAFPFDCDPAQIRALLEQVCEQITSQYPDDLLKDAAGQFVEPPHILGVTDILIDERGGRFAITARTKPDSVWKVERAMRELIWAKAREQHIALAYPYRKVEQIQGAK
ncbi:MAG TPA: mechanosensitive ion channel [Firmicutes bacterium]|nr:mechanosensitive ion channel [Bacillota bacterium]